MLGADWSCAGAEPEAPQAGIGTVQYWVNTEAGLGGELDTTGIGTRLKSRPDTTGRFRAEVCTH